MAKATVTQDKEQEVVQESTMVMNNNSNVMNNINAIIYNIF